MGRLETALGVACGAHAAVALAIASVAIPPPHAADAAPPPDAIAIVVDEGAVNVAEVDTAAGASEPPAASVARKVAADTAPARELASAMIAVAPDTPSEEARSHARATATTTDPGVRSWPPILRPTAIDLSLARRWDTPTTPARPPQASAVQRSILEALDADDRAHGIDPAGPLVSAAHDAATTADAPDVGRATFEVISDAAGKVVEIAVLDASPGTSWAGVSRAMVAAMTTKRLRTPAGARGLRARLLIDAERARPSGEHGHSYAGAVPDDVPGMDRACEGEGLTRKCSKGMPLGATFVGSDVTNVGARARRIVHVRILGSERI